MEHNNCVCIATVYNRLTAFEAQDFFPEMLTNLITLL